MASSTASTGSYPYHFPSAPPSEQDLAARRLALDRSGTLAQISALVALGLFFAARSSLLPGSTTTTTTKGSRPRSWLDRPVVQGWETWRVVLPVAAWAVWIFGAVVVRGTGDDYLHLTKQASHVGAALLPFHLLLASSSSLLAPLVSSRVRSQLLAYHRAHAALVLVPLFAAHALLYLNFYARVSVLSRRLRDADVQLGVGLNLTTLAMTLLSAKPIRSGSWRLLPGGRTGWVAAHVAAAGAILVMLWWHEPWSRVYVLEAAAVYGLGTAERLGRGALAASKGGAAKGKSA